MHLPTQADKEDLIDFEARAAAQRNSSLFFQQLHKGPPELEKKAKGGDGSLVDPQVCQDCFVEHSLEQHAVSSFQAHLGVTCRHSDSLHCAVHGFVLAAAFSNSSGSTCVQTSR